MADQNVNSQGDEQSNQGPDPSTQQAPATNPLLGQAEPTIPKGLEKFVGTDGKLDVNRLSASYLEAEKGMRSREQENTELRKAFGALSEQRRENAANSSPNVVPQNVDDALAKLAENPHNYVKTVATEVLEQLGAPLAEQVSAATLQQMHPELRDSKFMDGLKSWMGTLPPSVADAEKSLDGADFLIKEYKKINGIQATTSQAGPSFTNREGPSPTRIGGSNQRFTRSHIRELMRKNPAEYKRLEPEIAKARAEGRVDSD